MRLCNRVCKRYTINSGGHSVFSNFIFIVYCQRPQVDSKYRKTGVTFVRQFKKKKKIFPSSQRQNLNILGNFILVAVDNNLLG